MHDEASKMFALSKLDARGQKYARMRLNVVRA